MAAMRVLVVDVGGNNIKLLANEGDRRAKTPSGADLTPALLLKRVAELTAGWPFDYVSLGCPGPVSHDRLTREPHNLGSGWINFDFAEGFGRPTRVINDAAMQAAGSYDGGKMLFLGLGTGLGAALVTEGVVVPLEIAHLPYQKKWSYEDCVGRRGLDRLRPKGWELAVHDVVNRLMAAFLADYVVLGGGNAKRLRALPARCRLGANELAFKGGLRLWGRPQRRLSPLPLVSLSCQARRMRRAQGT